ncbi:transposase family protein [Streptomyces avermitilis]
MASKAVEAVLFPGIDVRVGRVSDSSDVLVVEAVSTARPGRCPDCRKQARRIHSTYQHALNEGPLATRRVMVRLRVRRYFCDRKSCSRKTFVEQVPGRERAPVETLQQVAGEGVSGGDRDGRGAAAGPRPLPDAVRAAPAPGVRRPSGAAAGAA